MGQCMHPSKGRAPLRRPRLPRGGGLRRGGLRNRHQDKHEGGHQEDIAV